MGFQEISVAAKNCYKKNIVKLNSNLSATPNRKGEQRRFDRKQISFLQSLLLSTEI